MKRIPLRCILIIFLTVYLFPVKAQELRCRVSMNTSQIQGSNRAVFNNLQAEISRFMNNRSWTGLSYEPEERIECSLFLTISDENNNTFRGTLQIQSERPVFGSSYKTVLLNYLDPLIEFSYVDNEVLEFNESSFTSNFTSLLAYYAYLIIGLDADSFSPMGGSLWFTKAEAVVSNAQNAKERGWKAFDGSGGRNRYTLVQNIMNNRYRDIRSFMYDYHRSGLDKLSQSVTEGRMKAMQSLSLLDKIYESRPDSYMVWIQLICDAKANEWANMFASLPESEKKNTVDLLKRLNPSNISLYESLFKK